MIKNVANYIWVYPIKRTSFGNSYDPTTASMIAIDNITYGTVAVPEPADWAMILGFVSLIFVVAKRRRY